MSARGMQQNNIAETLIGAAVVAVAIAFLAFGYLRTGSGSLSGYEVNAKLAKVDGLSVGTDVRLSGIKIGTVVSQSLDPATYDAVVRLSVAHGIKLPEDTVASVSSEGLLGGKFIKLSPGKSQTMIAEGGALGPSKNFKSIEEMVGQLIFLATTDNQPSAAKP